MKNTSLAFMMLLTGMLYTGCQSEKPIAQSDSATDYSAIPDSVYEYLAIPKEGNLSAASKRALERNYAKGPNWYAEFETYELKGDFAYQEGVTRRDPSDLIKVDGKYYVYYSKATGKTAGFGTGDPENKVFPWDKTDVWYATSEDGETWKEQGMAVGRGPAGAYDDRSVFTPQVLMHEGKYILIYQTVKYPYVNRVKNQVGMAISDSPAGPFVKLDKPILSPTDDGEWLGEEDSRFKVKKQGSFDSHKVHDPTLVYFNNKFYLYYKGERMGEHNTFGGREIKWGVAIADKLEGPYVKSAFNPITNSGHELCVWPYRGGIAALIITDGPERNTIQWSPDGVNFEIMSHIKWGPPAAGLDKTVDNDKFPLAALQWGLTHQYVSYDWQYIKGFRMKQQFHPEALGNF
ncbi:glycosyl hydrolase [Pontibacter sp. E15-1]|uniref:glycoside hydrolase family 117 protein n=1 Tax=Pontibacter sp. E15-1 TaxID=2919918 RepID=UPI001F4F3DDC|nr:glycosyl hydrolase [Pontibacter sp. E15-1]MCJ8163294.1 glycosyl hydrolase [Pontibacter sp. E15-1]